MKTNYLALITALILLNGCKNDIDITADYKETPIIYGLLNIDSNFHYIKIYKAYLDENTNALDIAQNPDSIYYSDSVIVSIERQSNGQKIYLSKVDGNTIGKPMGEGIFANSPNILYTFNQTLNKDETYILNFENPKTGVKAKATTMLVNDFQINSPPDQFSFNFTSKNPFEVQWKAAPNSRISDLSLRFYYNEWNVNNPSNKVLKFVEWQFAKGIISTNTNGGEQLSAIIQGSSFYSFLNSAIPVDANLRREAPFECIELYYSVGGETLYNYIRVNQAQSGITSLQTLPEYTNIEGGLGIFSSRKFKVKGQLRLTNPSIDSLSCGSTTKQLNFVNQTCF
jgi:hypothetical protein